MLTSYDDDEALFAAIMAGAAGYLLKQIRGLQLVESIRRAAKGESLLDPKVTARVLERLRSGPKQDPRLASLTDQERRILDLIAEGLTNRQIGTRLGLAEKTVKNYVSSLLAKIGMRSRTQAALYHLGAEVRARRGGRGTKGRDGCGAGDRPRQRASQTPKRRAVVAVARALIRAPPPAWCSARLCLRWSGRPSGWVPRPTIAPVASSAPQPAYRARRQRLRRERGAAVTRPPKAKNRYSSVGGEGSSPGGSSATGAAVAASDSTTSATAETWSSSRRFITARPGRPGRSG